MTKLTWIAGLGLIVADLGLADRVSPYHRGLVSHPGFAIAGLACLGIGAMVAILIGKRTTCPAMKPVSIRFLD